MRKMTKTIDAGPKFRNTRDQISPGAYTFVKEYIPKDYVKEYPDSTTTNEELVIKYQAGELDFAILVERYKPLLVRKSKEWVPEHSQEELFQELVLKLYSCCSSWTSSSNTKFMTYLYTSLDNAVAHLIRTGFNQKNKINNVELASYEAIVDWGYDTPIEEPPERALVEIIEGLELSDRERICVEMIIEGRQNIEIAARLSITKNRVGQIIRRLAPKFEFLVSPS